MALTASHISTEKSSSVAVKLSGEYSKIQSVARRRIERSPDDLLARLRQHLDGHVVRNQALLDQLAHEVVIRLRRRRKTDLDFLVAHLDQQLEHPELAFRVHRLDQRLVTVAQI